MKGAGAAHACVMPPVWPASVHVAERMWVSYSATTPEYAPAASTPLASGLYARHEMMPARRGSPEPCALVQAPTAHCTTPEPRAQWTGP